MTELSDEAISMLVNADPYTGGRVGSGEAAAELRAAGLLTVSDRLTAQGAAEAKTLQGQRWPAQHCGQQRWEAPGDLSDAAADSLLNAHRRTGGRPGTASAATYAELHTAGLLSAKHNLTAKGAALARQIQDERWPEGERF